eukprot:5433974-Heterocapsa_arctica.AAC.1
MDDEFFGAESAPTPHVGESPYEPKELFIHPAETYCGDLKVCDIDDAHKEAVMSEMIIASDGDIGMNRWYRDAVELSRFYKGGPSDNLIVCSQMTAARIAAFISPALQTEGQRWMADHIASPHERAMEAYLAHITANELESSRVDDRL